MKAFEIKEGMKIALSGYQWLVKKVTYDPVGNTGTQPRMLFTCDAIGDHWLPAQYAKDCVLGRTCNSEISIVETK